MVNDSKQPAQSPYLMAALLCDDTLEEKDGRLSILRLASDVTLEAGPNPPEEMPAFTARVTAVISFNAGGRPGTYEVHLMVIDPDGTERQGPTVPIDLKHDHFTANVIVKLQIRVRVAGVYWVKVLLAGREVTRMPLSVRYVRKMSAGKPQPSEGESSPHTTH